MYNIIPKVAAIHDITGEGRVSGYQIISILSTMGIKTNLLPTAVLSSNTEFEEFILHDMTETMRKTTKHWKSIRVHFDAVYSGFLGSKEQIEIVKSFISSFKEEKQIILIDPVMGDDGILYPCFDDTYAKEMKQLVPYANVMTPNITEAAILLDRKYSDAVTIEDAVEMAKALSQIGPEKVIITSVPGNDRLSSYTIAYDKNLAHHYYEIKCNYIPQTYPGTGDAFATVVLGSLLNNDTFIVALERAVQFVATAIHSSYGHSYDKREGIIIEKVLSSLQAPALPTAHVVSIKSENRNA